MGKDQTRALNLQCHELNLEGNRSQIEAGNGHRQLKPARTCASRIYVEDAAAFVLSGLVRVAADDNLETRSPGIQVESIDIVKNINRRRTSFYDGSFRQRSRPILLVHVSADRDNRRECPQGIENLRFAHVSSVNDKVRTSQNI